MLRRPPILSSTGQLRTAEKAVFAHCMQKKKKSAVFPSKVLKKNGNLLDDYEKNYLERKKVKALNLNLGYQLIYLSLTLYGK